MYYFSTVRNLSNLHRVNTSQESVGLCDVGRALGQWTSPYVLHISPWFLPSLTCTEPTLVWFWASELMEESVGVSWRRKTLDIPLCIISPWFLPFLTYTESTLVWFWSKRLNSWRNLLGWHDVRTTLDIPLCIIPLWFLPSLTCTEPTLVWFWASELMEESVGVAWRRKGHGQWSGHPSMCYFSMVLPFLIYTESTLVWFWSKRQNSWRNLLGWREVGRTLDHPSMY